jgi:predicted alpha/beta superfamily hydrolase
LLIVAAAYLFLQTPDRPHTLTGDIRSHPKFHSRFLANDRDVLVYVPPDYEKEKGRRYPVFYLQDGQNVFDGATSFLPGQEWRADENAEALIREGRIQPLIIVAINNAGKERANEYTPTADEKYKQGGKADLYSRMMVEELKPFIDAHYRTLGDARNTAIGGSSLGANVSIYLGMTRPDVFGKIAVVSPAIWWNDREMVRRVKALPGKLDLRIWLDIGTAEGSTPEWHVRNAQDLRDALIEKGWRMGKDLYYMEAPGAAHNEKAWAGRIGEILQFLFPVSK